MSEVAVDLLDSVSVRLIGVLGSAAGNRELEVPVPGALNVQGLIAALLKQVGTKFFRDLLVDAGTEDPRANVIILLNDQDYNIFEGLKTRIEPGTKVTIIPVAHGG